MSHFRSPSRRTCPSASSVPARPSVAARSTAVKAARRAQFARKRSLGGVCNSNDDDLYTASGQTLQGSFSAVPKLNFASK